MRWTERSWQCMAMGLRMCSENAFAIMFQLYKRLLNIHGDCRRTIDTAVALFNSTRSGFLINGDVVLHERVKNEPKIEPNSARMVTKGYGARKPEDCHFCLDNLYKDGRVLHSELSGFFIRRYLKRGKEANVGYARLEKRKKEKLSYKIVKKTRL